MRSVSLPPKPKPNAGPALTANRKHAPKLRQPTGHEPSSETAAATGRVLLQHESYGSAVRAAAVKAGLPVWSPNRLRHAAATAVRKSHGLEGAQILLGHASADVTQVYAERDHELGRRVAAEVG